MEQQVLGNIFSALISGAMQGLQEEQQPEIDQHVYERQLQEQRQALQEQLDRQEAARRQQEAFQQEQLKAYGQLKGRKSPQSFDLKSAQHGNRQGDKHWQRLHCSAYLSDLAQAARKRKDDEEAAFLNEQAMQVLAGGKPAVQCPDAPPRPELAKAEAPTPQDQFYQSLMQKTKHHLDQLAALQERINTLKATRQQTGSPEALEKALSEKKQIIDAMGRDQKLFQEVQTHPDKAEQALARMQGGTP